MRDASTQHLTRSATALALLAVGTLMGCQAAPSKTTAVKTSRFLVTLPCRSLERNVGASLARPASPLPAPVAIRVWGCPDSTAAVVHYTFSVPIMDATGPDPVLREFVPLTLAKVPQFVRDAPLFTARIMGDELAPESDSRDYDYRVEAGPVEPGTWGRARAVVGNKDLVVVLALGGLQARAPATTAVIDSFHVMRPSNE